MELDIIKILSDRELYYKYRDLIKEELLTEQAYIIIQDIDEWFKEDSTRNSVDWSSFRSWFKVVKHPMFKEEKSKIYDSLFDKLEAESELDETAIQKILETFLERDYATQIAEIAYRIADGDSKLRMDDIHTLMESYIDDYERISKEEKEFVSQDLSTIIGNVVSGGGMDWRLDCLNESIGPIRRGDLILLGARPETGKTTFLASETAFMASQMDEDKYVLWFNNEEEGQKVKFRIVQAALGKETHEIESDPKNSLVEYEKIVGHWDKIKVFDKASISPRDIERIVKKYPPGLIVIDQLRKCRGFERQANNGVDRLRMLYEFARKLAKEHAPVITVHQARGDASGQKWINENQLEGCQTEIQGELDVQIMMGKIFESGYEYNRYINIVKNKLAGGPKCNPDMRHGKYEVLIEPEIARFKY